MLKEPVAVSQARHATLFPGGRHSWLIKTGKTIFRFAMRNGRERGGWEFTAPSVCFTAGGAGLDQFA